MYCFKNQQSRFSVKSSQGDYNVTPGEESCSTGISGKLDIERDIKNVLAALREKPGSINDLADVLGWKLTRVITAVNQLRDKGKIEQEWSVFTQRTPLRISRKLDIDRDTEDVDTSPGGNSCSTGIARNLDGVKVSEDGLKIGVSDSLPIGTRVCHRKLPDRGGTVIKAIVGSTRYHVRWDVGSTSAVEGRNLTVIPVEQGDYRKLLTTDPDYLSEVDGQLTIFSEDEPPEPDDFENEAAYLRAWKRWELQYPQLAEAVRQAESELQIFGVEQKADIPVEQPSQAETIKVPKTRNTKPGRGSRPRQVKCNVTRNHSKSKSANTYWVYSFSFKVDGKYYDRSVSVPQEKVNQVIELWESKQYYWRDIVEYIGKNPDKIISKVRDKNNE